MEETRNNWANNDSNLTLSWLKVVYCDWLVLAPRFLFFRSCYFVLGSPFLNSLKTDDHAQYFFELGVLGRKEGGGVEKIGKPLFSGILDRDFK